MEANCKTTPKIEQIFNKDKPYRQTNGQYMFRVGAPRSDKSASEHHYFLYLK